VHSAYINYISKINGRAASGRMHYYAGVHSTGNAAGDRNATPSIHRFGCGRVQTEIR
jgi:hypothetical protein